MTETRHRYRKLCDLKTEGYYALLQTTSYHGVDFLAEWEQRRVVAVAGVVAEPITEIEDFEGYVYLITEHERLIDAKTLITGNFVLYSTYHKVLLQNRLKVNGRQVASKTSEVVNTQVTEKGADQVAAEFLKTRNPDWHSALMEVLELNLVCKQEYALSEDDLAAMCQSLSTTVIARPKRRI